MAALNKAIDKQSLKGLSPLGKLTHDKIDDIISKSRVENLPAGRTLFRQGEDDGQTVYLLSGQIELSTAGSTHKHVIKGKSIEAKFPIADKVPRPATARTKAASSLLYIDSSLLEILLDDNPSVEYEVTEISVADQSTGWMMRFLQSRAFLRLPTENIQQVLMSMEEIQASKGDTLIRQGDDGDYYYIIKTGSCAVSRRPVQKAEEIRLARLTEGDGFGEEALITNSKRNATVTMLENGTLMRLKKADFLSLLVAPLSRNVHLNSLKSSLYTHSVILDIRTSAEFRNGSIDKAKHIPLSMIRLRIPTLDSTKQHLIYADNKDDANAAAFLLAQHGIDCLVIQGLLRQNLPIVQHPAKDDVQTDRQKPDVVPVTGVVDMNPKQKHTNGTASIEKQFVTQPEAHLASSEQTSISGIPESPVKSDQPQSKANAPLTDKLRQEVEYLQVQARKEAEQILAQAETIRQSALQEASRLRDKIEKEETLRLRTELEDTRNRAEAAIRKSGQLAEQIRQQAEQESSQIRQQALSEAEQLRAEITQLREQEAQMKLQLESELLNIRQQAAEQARLEAEQEAEEARQAAEQAAEQARAAASQEAQAARLAAEQARAAADRLTDEAHAIEREAEQFRRKAEQEAEAIRQAAFDEANRIKRTALQEIEETKRNTPVETKPFIRHDNIFDLDEEFTPTVKPVLPYADEASEALQMAREIKARLVTADQQRVQNEQAIVSKPAKQKAVIQRLKGKTILEGEEDIFIFKEPGKPESDNNPTEQANTHVIRDTAQQTPARTGLDKIAYAAPGLTSTRRLATPVGLADDEQFDKASRKGKARKSLLTIAASILLIITLSLAAYTTRIQINFSEVGALVNRETHDSEEQKNLERKNFQEKISTLPGK